MNCINDVDCMNMCNKKVVGGFNATCYLVDEHGIVILSNSLKSIISLPLHKINPWLMFQLEYQGIYNLIIPGSHLDECSKPPTVQSGAIRLIDIISSAIRILSLLFVNSLELASYLLGNVATAYSSAIKDIDQNEFRIKNGHCHYFGIYSFNYTKWKSLNASEFRTWCNSTPSEDTKQSFIQPRRFLAGHIKYSNLIMLIVEDEPEFSRCGSIDVITKQYRVPASLKSSASPNNVNEQSKSSVIRKAHYQINRFRQKPLTCFNIKPNESLIFQCSSSKASQNGMLSTYKLTMFIFFAISTVFLAKVFR